MMHKTRRTLAVASLVGVLSLGLSASATAAPSWDAADRAPRMAQVDRGSFGSWLQALLGRLLTVWAAEGGSESGTGAPTH